MENKKPFKIANDLIFPSIGFASHIITNNNHHRHSHEFFEISYMLAGDMWNKVDDNPEELLSIGDCYVLGKNATHSVRTDVYSLNRDIMISEEFFFQIADLLSFSSNLFHSDSFVKLKLSLEDITEFEELLKSISNEEHFEKKRCLGINLLSKIFYRVLDSHFNKEELNKPALVQKILFDLDKEIFVREGIPSLIEDCGYSQAHVCREFKKYMGVTLSDYLRDIRLEHAAYYLQTTNYSLREITDIVGIESLSYFHKIFKNKYAQQPLQYRKAHSRRK